MQKIILYGFYFLCGISATGILLTRNVFKAALMLLVCLLSAAALYVLMFAEFVAVTQILIYAGGMVIVIIFGIMLTTKMKGKPLVVESGNIFSGLLCGSAMFVILSVPLGHAFGEKKIPAVETPRDTIGETGIELMTSYLLPFELAGILLLMALIGAAVVATSHTRKI